MWARFISLQHCKGRIALKTLSSTRFASERSKARFAREVELAASLQHPNIARVYESGLDQGVWYYAMELVDGAPARRVRQNAETACRADPAADAPDLPMAMQHAHQCRGVIHRDIKPSNILVSKDWQPHILDL